MDRLPGELVNAILHACASESLDTVLSAAQLSPRFYAAFKANEDRLLDTLLLEIPVELLDAVIVLGNGVRRVDNEDDPEYTSKAAYFDHVEKIRKRRDRRALYNALRSFSEIMRFTNVFVAGGFPFKYSTPLAQFYARNCRDKVEENALDRATPFCLVLLCFNLWNDEDFWAPNVDPLIRMNFARDNRHIEIENTCKAHMLSSVGEGTMRLVEEIWAEAKEKWGAARRDTYENEQSLRVYRSEVTFVFETMFSYYEGNDCWSIVPHLLSIEDKTERAENLDSWLRDSRQGILQMFQYRLWAI